MLMLIEESLSKASCEFKGKFLKEIQSAAIVSAQMA